MNASNPTGHLEAAGLSREAAAVPAPRGADLQAPRRLKLNLFAGEVCISKLAALDAGSLSGRTGVLAAVFERNQVSLIHEADAGLEERALAHEDGWRVLQIDGVLEFGLSGILHRVLAPLAEAGVGVLVVSSFDTDYILVKKEHLFAVTRCLTDHRIEVRRREARPC